MVKNTSTINNAEAMWETPAHNQFVKYNNL